MYFVHISNTNIYSPTHKSLLSPVMPLYLISVFLWKSPRPPNCGNLNFACWCYFVRLQSQSQSQANSCFTLVIFRKKKGSKRLKKRIPRKTSMDPSFIQMTLKRITRLVRVILTVRSKVWMWRYKNRCQKDWDRGNRTLRFFWVSLGYKNLNLWRVSLLLKCRFLWSFKTCS